MRQYTVCRSCFMATWIERHFSTSERAQTTIAVTASVIAAVGAIMFAVAAFLLTH